jgi:hypothetical protein
MTPGPAMAGLQCTPGESDDIDGLTLRSNSVTCLCGRVQLPMLTGRGFDYEDASQCPQMSAVLFGYVTGPRGCQSSIFQSSGRHCRRLGATGEPPTELRRSLQGQTSA